jgi:hypothetical protein
MSSTENTDHKLIPLTRGLAAKVSPIDYDHLVKWKWYANRGGRGGLRWHAKRGMGKLYMSMHRQILGAASGVEVDHINGDPLDNRRENLRVANRSQNMANIPPRSKTGFKGVHRTKSGRFQVCIRHNWKLLHLGTFDCPSAAARAYDAKAKELFGEFARPNIAP